MKIEKDYYQILGISRSASIDEIKKAYRLYAAKFHPDKHDGDVFFEDRFKELMEAYDTLSDEQKRTKYDIKKFGTSKVVRKTSFDKEDSQTTKTKRIRIDVAHLEIYLTLFYLINLTAWVIFRRISFQTSAGGHIWSLFLCGVSTLLMWVFFRGLVDWQRDKRIVRRDILAGCLILALLIGGIPLFTNWIQ